MYVDDHGDDTSTTDTHGGEDQLTVEVDGETFEVEENYDFDGDNENDTAVVETEDGYIAFADTNHDGKVSEEERIRYEAPLTYRSLAHEDAVDAQTNGPNAFSLTEVNTAYGAAAAPVPA